jgi:myosin-7
VQEEELVELLAQHCYIQLGTSVGSKDIQELLPSCIPSKLYKTKSPEKWANLVITAHAKVGL